MDPQNPWVPFHTFQKSVGSAEPTEPTLTTPLLNPKWALRLQFRSLSCPQASLGYSTYPEASLSYSTCPEASLSLCIKF